MKNDLYNFMKEKFNLNFSEPTIVIGNDNKSVIRKKYILSYALNDVR
jgi:hypothetical protein